MSEDKRRSDYIADPTTLQEIIADSEISEQMTIEQNCRCQSVYGYAEWVFAHGYAEKKQLIATGNKWIPSISMISDQAAVISMIHPTFME